MFAELSQSHFKYPYFCFVIILLRQANFIRFSRLNLSVAWDTTSNFFVFSAFGLQNSDSTAKLGVSDDIPM